jgi:high-affinity iron transporter
VLASLLIVFREVLEAGLIVGIVAAATKGIAGRSLWISLGIAAGVAGALLVAVFASQVANAFEGVGQEIMTATILGVAVLMLGWHNIWMAAHAREVTANMRQLGNDVQDGQKSLFALALVIAVALLREGSEVVLFLFGIASASHEPPIALLMGGFGGIALGALVAFLLYRGLVAIPMRHLFRVTNWLIALLAAGMAGQAALVLTKVDLLPSWGDQLWDTSHILPENSLFGRALQALIGYSDRPNGIQLAAYLATLATLALLSRHYTKNPAVSPV